jgi:hypothetical protein
MMNEFETRSEEHQRIQNFVRENSQSWTQEEQTKFIQYCQARSNTPELDLAIMQMFAELKPNASLKCL